MIAMIKVQCRCVLSMCMPSITTLSVLCCLEYRMKQDSTTSRVAIQHTCTCNILLCRVNSIEIMSS